MRKDETLQEGHEPDFGGNQERHRYARTEATLRYGGRTARRRRVLLYRVRVSSAAIGPYLPSSATVPHLPFCFAHFSRFFVNAFTLREHKRSKQHKQRVRELKVAPYSHEESLRAAGMGSYTTPAASCYVPEMEIDGGQETVKTSKKKKTKTAHSEVPIEC